MKETLLMTFVRNPELGKVKTRLAKGIGKTAALEVYIQLLHHTKKILQTVAVDKWIWYSETIEENDLWNSLECEKKLQPDTDLGKRMQHAFEEAFNAGYQKVIIIGSDLYDLQKKHLLQAIDALEQHEIVLGPAKDGGYYLLGMTQLHPQAFLPKEWGTETVLKNTLYDLNDKKNHLLETLNDIDYAEDLQPYEAFQKYLKS